LRSKKSHILITGAYIYLDVSIIGTTPTKMLLLKFDKITLNCEYLTNFHVQEGEYSIDSQNMCLGNVSR